MATGLGVGVDDGTGVGLDANVAFDAVAGAIEAGSAPSAGIATLPRVQGISATNALANPSARRPT